MTPNELVGKRIKQARESLPQLVPGRRSGRLDQATLGQLLAKYLGKPWTKQAISAAETGRRVIDVTELVAFASVLGRPVWFFLAPEVGESIEMPSGVEPGAHFNNYTEFGESYSASEVRPDRNSEAVLLSRSGLEEALTELGRATEQEQAQPIRAVKRNRSRRDRSGQG